MIPGLTLPNGTYVPPHEALVYYDGHTPLQVLAFGGGDLWQREAHAQLAAQHPQWTTFPVESRALHVLALATDMHDAVVSEAALTKAHRWWTGDGVGHVISAIARPDPLWEFLHAPRLALP